MKLLKEIFRDQGLNLAGRTLVRESAKAIINQGRQLLMVFSTHEGGYKFPGGRVEAGETYEQTLAREIAEECGADMVKVTGEFGMVTEYKVPFELGYDVFKMVSRYYLCQIQDGSGELHLDDYEEELGYRPQWVDLDDAIQVNSQLSSLTGKVIPGWVVREAYVLELVKRFFDGPQINCPRVPAQPAGDPL
jgi:ADP-ribose pyrophosphatase YjhB (NUDIX family)